MIVIDANIAVALIVRLPYSEKAEQLFLAWHRNNSALFAPSLWHSEIVSALHKLAFAGQMSAEDAHDGIRKLDRLRVEIIPPDTDLLLASFEWAGKLNQMAAYDAQYMALAERLGAEMWTADRRLFNSVKAEIPWLHWVGSLSQT